jgi:hypothetical protein
MAGKKVFHRVAQWDFRSADSWARNLATEKAVSLVDHWAEKMVVPKDSNMVVWWVLQTVGKWVAQLGTRRGILWAVQLGAGSAERTVDYWVEQTDDESELEKVAQWVQWLVAKTATDLVYSWVASLAQK